MASCFAFPRSSCFFAITSSCRCLSLACCTPLAALMACFCASCRSAACSNASRCCSWVVGRGGWGGVGGGGSRSDRRERMVVWAWVYAAWICGGGWGGGWEVMRIHTHTSSSSSSSSSHLCHTRILHCQHQPRHHPLPPTTNTLCTLCSMGCD